MEKMGMSCPFKNHNFFLVLTEQNSAFLRLKIKVHWFYPRMTVACNVLASCDKSSLQDELSDILSLTLVPLLFITFTVLPMQASLRHCSCTSASPQSTASSCSSFETTHFAVCTCLIWKALNHPGISLTRQTLKHHLCLKLCCQVPRETYSKFTEMKNRSPHRTLPWIIA